MKIKREQGKRQAMIGAAVGVCSFVVVSLIVLSGCQDDPFVRPILNPNISIKSEKVKQEERQEFERCLKAAELGNSVEQNNLGTMYAIGEGIKQDNVQAVKWYRKAAEQGEAGAQYNLGNMYSRGKGVKQDFTQAEEWYRKAARQGHELAKQTMATWGQPK